MTKFDSQEFIQGFLEEADEHIRNITSRLLSMEKILQRQAGQPLTAEEVEEQKAQINEVFRSFHTIKGLSGMVGLDSAAELSHALESLLRDMQKGELTPSLEILDRLVSGTQTLAKIVETLRNPKASLPDIQTHIQAVKLLRGQKKDEKSSLETEETLEQEMALGANRGIPLELLEPLKDDLPRIIAAQSKYQRVTLALFTPSAQLAEQGINVNLARERLAGLGQLLKAAPLIHGKSIRFIFILATQLPVNKNDFSWLEWYELARDETPAPASIGQEPRPEKISEIPTAETPAAFIHTSTSVRVDISRMDELMHLVGELVVTRSRLSDTLPKLDGASSSARETLEETAGQIERQLRDLRQAVMRIRMVPLGDVFGRMPLAVRDLAKTLDKKVNLILEGETTEIDKALVERLLDPLLHLVRNAMTHGIEPPAERLAEGKPEEGNIKLKGYPVGDHIVIEVSDDGRGVDLKRVAQKAHSAGWLTDEAEISMEQALEFISRPGFSTKTEADLGAGRGVGMSVVNEMVNSLGGSLSLQTSLGQGSTFLLRLPLTLAIIDAMIVASGGERYAIPQNVVSEVFEVETKKIVQVAGGNEVFPYRGDSLSLLRLNHLFGTNGRSPALHCYGLIISQGTQRLAIVVDRIEGLREVVVRTVSDPLIAQPGVGGATELGDGSVILILDIPDLVRHTLTEVI